MNSDADEWVIWWGGQTELGSDGGRGGNEWNGRSNDYKRKWMKAYKTKEKSVRKKLGKILREKNDMEKKQ